LEKHVQNVILWPLIGQVVLISVVSARLYQTRIAEFRARKINPQSVKTSHTAAGVLEDVAAADNFRNLFEVPVLFFAVCLGLAITDLATPIELILAWVFVGFRAAHSLIHITYNRVIHRFTAYTLSTLCVFAMWVLFAISLWRDG